MGRAWHDRPGNSLLVGIVLEGTTDSRLTGLAEVAVARAVREPGGRGPLVEWPDELVCGCRKVGGILSESFRERGSAFTVV